MAIRLKEGMECVLCEMGVYSYEVEDRTFTLKSGKKKTIRNLGFYQCNECEESLYDLSAEQRIEAMVKKDR